MWSILLTGWEVFPVGDPKIQQIFTNGWNAYCKKFQPSPEQSKAAYCIMNCKSGAFGYNISRCEECGHMDFHANSCRNRNCPNCQAVLKELWIDKRSSELMDADYFHVVFTIPAALNPLVYANQKLLYSLLHRCSAETLLELCENKKYLGATPGIIQILHTWGQKLNYHPHIHCIVSGGGLSKTKDLKLCTGQFLVRIEPLVKKIRGKFLAHLQQYYAENKLHFSGSCRKLRNHYNWNAFKNSLYSIDWNAEIKETFNGNGNAIEYLGRYANRIAITNARIISVTQNEVSFHARDYKTNEQTVVTVSCVEFIRRFMMHVLPGGFQKIRYYGFLNNRWKSRNLAIIFRIQGHRRFISRLSGLSMEEVLLKVWNYSIRTCPSCGCCNSMRHSGRTYAMKN